MHRTIGPGALRFMLAVMVVVSHFTHLEIGRLAVMAFFVLSGYWVMLMFRRKYADGIQGVLIFYGSRMARIFPVYLAIMAITWAVDYLAGGTKAPGIYDFTLLNLANVPVNEPILRPAWSLDIELQFYFLVPFLSLAMTAAPSRRRVALFLGSAIALTIGYWLFGIGLLGYNVLAYGVTFAFGAAAAMVDIRPTRTMALASLAVFVLIGIGLALTPGLRWTVIKGDNDFVQRDVVAMLWVMALVPFILWNVTIRSVGMDRPLGEIAYTLYLCQWMFAKYCDQMFAFLPERYDRMAAGILCAFIASFALYMLVDRPIERLRHRLFQSRATSPPKPAGKSSAGDSTLCA